MRPVDTDNEFRTVFTTFAAWFAFLLEPIWRRIRDLKTAERIGIDRPRWFERALMRIFRYRDITKTIDGVRILYMRRFYLSPRVWPVRFFLHHIVRSDDDRAPHSHPFDFSTSLLKGTYLEEIDVNSTFDGPADVRTMRAGCTSINPAEHCHRVDVIESVWSLVVCSRARREWGFITPEGEIPWRKYLGLPGEPDAQEDRIKGAA